MKVIPISPVVVSECAYMVQIDALSTPEYQEGVPRHSRWTARGRTWGSPLCSRRTFITKERLGPAVGNSESSLVQEVLRQQICGL